MTTCQSWRVSTSALLARMQAEIGQTDMPQPDAPVEPAASAAAVETPPAAASTGNVVDLAETRLARQAEPEAAANAKGDDARSQPMSAPATIRVDLDRLDRLVNLVGELVINRAMVAQRVMEAGLANSTAISVGLDEPG